MIEGRRAGRKKKGTTKRTRKEKRIRKESRIKRQGRKGVRKEGREEFGGRAKEEGKDWMK